MVNLAPHGPENLVIGAYLLMGGSVKWEMAWNGPVMGKIWHLLVMKWLISIVLLKMFH